MIFLLYWLLCLVSCLYVFSYGGKEGRIVTLLLMISTISTYWVYENNTWAGTNISVFLVDLFFFIGLLILTFRSDKNWIVWLTGIQLVGVMTHISAGIGISFPPRLYQLFQGFWAIPFIIVMIVAIHGNRVFYEEKFNFISEKQK